MSAAGPAQLRRVAHLDMDAFYASVELLRYPQLQGLPLVIGGRREPDSPAARGEFTRLRDYSGRGVVTTASYAARQFGVHSAMGLMKAAQLCPQAFLLPADFEQYRHYSRLFKQVLARFVPLIEDRGIDEVYLDFTDAEDGQLEGGRVLAARLQAAIHQESGLTCSIGVAPNKLLAKIASELNKPNGISVLYESDLAARIWPLACRKIHGIGPKASAQLTQHGIHDIGALARCERTWLMQQFGRSSGAWMHEAAWGRDDRPVVAESEPVSLSRETTFERDLHATYDRAQLRSEFIGLCEQVARDLQRHGYAGRTIGVKLRYDNFVRQTRDQTIEAPTNDVATIRAVAAQCLRRAELTRRLRLLGVKVSGLARVETVAAAGEAAAPSMPQLPLF
jgi:DNA polymerase-4